MSTVITNRHVFTDDADNEIVFNSRGTLQWAYLSLASTAAVGNRQVELRIKDSAGNVLYSCPAGAVQAASLTRTYLFMPGVAREAAFVGNAITVPMPPVLIPYGGKVQVLDTAGIALAADDMVFSYGFEAE
jgi:hypothetical protein